MAGQLAPHTPLGRGGAIVGATFVARPNRFLVEALLDGAIVQAHLADRGRLKETLLPGARLLLARATGTALRKTQFQAVAAYVETPDGPRLASLDTHLPNRLIETALRQGALEPFAAYPHIRREVTVGASRFDFVVSDGARRCLIEVKSAGLVLGDVALFPDAPTTRGARHLHELAELAGRGEQTALVFVAAGAQAQVVAINDAIDPAFSQALAHARQAGVAVHAYACPLDAAGITLGPSIPVALSEHAAAAMLAARSIASP